MVGGVLHLLSLRLLLAPDILHHRSCNEAAYYLLLLTTYHLLLTIYYLLFTIYHLLLTTDY